jgi:alcohol dehydrogenase
MQQLTMTADRQVEWWDVPAPALQGAGEALVRPLAVALCDLDQPILRGAAPIPGPIAIGHEFVAEVTEVGEDVRGVAPGDRVVVPFQISCGACARCRGGQTGDCTSVPPRSMYGFGAFGGDWGGARSDLVRVPFADAMLVAAPAGIAPPLASASDNIPDGWRTVAPHSGQYPGADVLVVGGGGRSIALYAVDAAARWCAGRVVYATPIPAGSRGAQLGARRPSRARRASLRRVRDHRGSPAPTLGCTPRCARSSPGGVHEHRHLLRAAHADPGCWRCTRRRDPCDRARDGARGDARPCSSGVAAGDLHPERVTSNVVSWEQAAERSARSQTKLVIER